MSIFIGGAWPYANGSLHIGHIASLLPGDILARYYRQIGEKVLYVSGSDCNGTPIAIQAKKEGKNTKEIADYYHKEFEYCFQKLGFSYDLYTRTDSYEHSLNIRKILNELYDKNLLYSKKTNQAFCIVDNQFLPDRLVEGYCPNCGTPARGDQCEKCSTILDPIELKNKTCKLCGNPPEIRQTEHLYFKFSYFQKDIEKYFENAKTKYKWRPNAINITNRYLKEGLRDRAVTRDLSIGVDVPIKGFENKKVYVWFEAVSGYLSASKIWGDLHNKDISLWWSKDTISYYIHGKDNVPFHTLIWPTIMKGLNMHSLPKHIVSSEYMTLEKKKISTSKNWAVWIPDLIEKYHPDSIRYFFTINAPEYKDADFSWREFFYSHNSELLGAFGNLVNRTFKFIEKYYSYDIPNVKSNENLTNKISLLYQELSVKIENAHLKHTLEEIFELVRETNQYFDKEKSWITIKENKEKCDETISNCILVIQNLAQLLHPFLPFSTNEIKSMLNLSDYSWSPILSIPNRLEYVKTLFERLDFKSIEEEHYKLLNEV